MLVVLTPMMEGMLLPMMISMLKALPLVLTSMEKVMMMTRRMSVLVVEAVVLGVVAGPSGLGPQGRCKLA